jgi:hypothetical protein
MKVLALILAGVSAAAPAADTALSIDGLAGVYKDRFQNGLVDGTNYTSEDVLEIVKVSPNEAYIRAELAFFNGHSCSISGIARRDGEKLVYRPRESHSDGPCALTLRRQGDKLVFGDTNGQCKAGYCGARGGFDDVGFKLSARRPIRYMRRLLASHEYAQAIAERDGKP